MASTVAFSQQGTIRGVVVDAATDETLPATVQIFDASGQQVNATVTPISGIFSLKVAPGSYNVRLSMIGYGADTIKGVSVSLAQVVNLERIAISVDAGVLEEVNIVERQENDLLSLDRRVFNVSEDLNSTGGQAADILRNVPSVNVDLDGNISLRGNQNVRIWIDGRPSTLIGLDDQSAIQQLPASMIERIEIITNPSSKYDADGTAGIINIITKKTRRRGWNGNVAGGVGTNNKYDANAYLSRREGAWTFFAGYGYNYNYRDGFGYDSRTNFLPDTTFTLNSDETSFRKNESHNMRLGTDWEITNSDVLSFTASWNERVRTSPEYADYTNLSEGELVTSSFRDVTEIRDRNSQDLALHYEHDPESSNGEKWVADFSYSRSFDNDFQDVIWEFNEYNNSTDSLPNVYQQFFETELEQMYVGSFDYERQISDWGKLELGWKSIWESSDEVRDATIRYDKTESFEDDSLRSNAFYFAQDIHAAYGNFGFTMGTRWKAQVGVRLEQAFTGGVARGVEYPNNYFNLFPSGFLTYSISETQDIQVSYSRRIDRPSEWALNPIIDYEDPQNLRSGNPNLQPEYTNSTEMSYIWYYEGGSVSSAMYYQYSTNVFTRFRRILPDGTSLTTFENLRERVRMGAEFTATGQFTPWLDGRANFNMFQSYIIADNLQEDLNQTGFSWFARVGANIDLPWNLQTQLTYNYRGAEPTGQGFRRAIQSLDVALARDFLDGKLNVNLRLNDVFNTRDWEYSIESADFNQSFYRKRESRIFFVNVTYRFGTQEKSRAGDREPRADGEGN